MKHLNRIPCRACLNTNYLPDNIRSLLLNPDEGWESCKGKFLLKFQHRFESVEAAKEFSSILKRGGILPSFFTIHGQEDFYQLTAYEDNICNVVRNPNAHLFIFNSIKMAYAQQQRSFVEC